MAGGSGDSEPLLRLGDYDLLEEIARGGMGVVYKARQRSLNRVVALKMIAGGQLATRQQVERFRAEAEAAASLQHPNIVAIHEVGEADGQHYFSMDYVPGRNLADLARDRPLSARDAARCLAKVAAAVHYAHQHGIIHRDLKPSNILIDAENEPRITDFGLAKRLTSDSDLTLSGQVVGSPSYLSPEQAAGKSGRVGPASDIYALGAVLYHLLTGRPPFQAETLTTLLKQVLEAEPVRPRLLNASIPKDLETICLKCLEKDPARRYGTAQAVGEDLSHYLNSEPIQARPVGAMGRSWRWCRRKPALAALVGTVMALLLTVTGVSVTAARRIATEFRRADQNARELRRNLYAADMRLVQNSIAENNRSRALQLLNAHRPRPGESDLRGWEWRYLWQQAKSDELETVATHEGAVTVVKYSPDGTWFATGGWDGKVVVRETSSKRILTTLPSVPEKSYCRPLAVSPNGRMIAVHGARGIDVYATTNWSLLRSLEDGRSSMAFSEDATLLAARCSHVSKIRVWHTRTWDMELHEIGYSDAQYFDSGLTFLPGSGYLAALNTTGSVVRLFELPLVTHRAKAEDGVSRNASVIPSGARWVAGHPSGRQLATATRWGKVHFWSLPDVHNQGEITVTSGDTFQVAFSPDGSKLAVACADSSVRLYDAATRTNLATYRGHLDEVWAVDFSPDGRFLLSGSRDGMCKLWDAKPDPNAQKVRISGGSWHRRGQCWMDGNGRQLVTFPTNRLPEWMTFDRGAFVGLPRRLLTNLTEITSVSMDATTALVQVTNDVAEVWDIPSERRIGSFRTTITRTTRLSFLVSPDHRFLYEMMPERDNARLWDLTSSQLIKVFEDYEANAWGMSFSPNGTLLARGSTNGTAQMWDIRAGKVRHNLGGHRWHVGTVAFSPDGRFLATGSWGADIYLWDVDSGRLILGPLLGHLQAVTQIVFTPDGKTLLTGGDENIMRAWNLATGREVAKLDDCKCFVLSPDGKTVAAWTRDPVWMGTSIRLVHVPTLAEIEAAERVEK